MLESPAYNFATALKDPRYYCWSFCKTQWWQTMCDKLQRAVWYSGALKGCEVHAESAGSSRQWPVETIMRHLEQLYRSNYPGATISQPFTVIRCFNSCTKARHKPAPLIVSCNNRRDSGTVLLREGWPFVQIPAWASVIGQKSPQVVHLRERSRSKTVRSGTYIQLPLAVLIRLQDDEYLERRQYTIKFYPEPNPKMQTSYL